MFWRNWRLKAKRVPYGPNFTFSTSYFFTHSTTLRYALQLLTPASILATLAGRSQIEVEDIAEMNELFLDAKTSAGMIGDGEFNKVS